jgi:hypothetical protein
MTQGITKNRMFASISLPTLLHFTMHSLNTLENFNEVFMHKHMMSFHACVNFHASYNCKIG